MKKAIWILCAVSILLLCGCDKSSSNPQINSSVNTPASRTDPLIGAWVYEYGLDYSSEPDYNLYFYFLDNGTCCLFEGYDGVDEKTYWNYMLNSTPLGSYSTSKDSLILTLSGGNMEFTYSISGNQLILKTDDETLKCSRHDVASTQANLSGSWQLVGTDGDFSSFGSSVTSSEYIRHLSFYQDGTYSAILYLYSNGEEHYFDENFNGDYEIIHDGRTVSFSNQAYYSFQLLGYGLLHLTDPKGNDLIYILQ